MGSFEGSDMKNATGRLSFRPVYPTDYHLEKLLRDVGGHTSQIAHVEGFPNMMLYGDRGYNDQEYFEFMAAAALSFLNTTQRGPLLPFKFGHTKYKCNREQQDISERGPRLSLGAVRKVGSVQSHLVAWRNGLRRVTFLQSSDPNLSYGHFYMTPSTEHEYAKKFKHAVDTLSVNPNYDPTELLSEREKERRLVHDAHDVLEATKGQVDP